MTKAAKVTRVDDAYERLREEILESRMPPGFQAPEPEIAERLGMSRTPVHEALIRLEGDGLVALVPRRGVKVLPLAPEDMREIYEILTALEPEAAASVAEARFDAEQLAPLHQATDDMERALAESDLDAWAAADDRFHRRLLNLHGNGRLTGFVQTLFDQAHRARMATLRLRDLPVKSTEEHRVILRCIADGDAEETRSIFRTHRRRAAKELLGVLERTRLTHL
ncbi:MAG: GntR family transcriptional regulator [Pseudomonadota bacterium]